MILLPFHLLHSQAPVMVSLTCLAASVRFMNGYFASSRTSNVNNPSLYHYHYAQNHSYYVDRKFQSFIYTVNIKVRLLISGKYERWAKQISWPPSCARSLHSGVNRAENFPRIAALWSICNAMPENVKNHLNTVYSLHPSLQSRLLLALPGRLIFAGGVHWKNYSTGLEFLWEHVKRKEIELPEFEYDHEKELDDYHPMMDYGMEGDHP